MGIETSAEGKTMTRSAQAIVGLLILLAAVLGGVAYWQYRKAQEAERQLGLDAGRVLKAVFVQANDLRVARLTGVAQAQSENQGTVFRTEQRTLAPFSVNYFTDLRKVGPADYEWDAKRRHMTVRIPDVTVEAPNIDIGKARAQVSGLWVSREAGIALAEKGSRILVVTATERARSDENMTKARAAAKIAVRDFVRQPLAAAGFGDVTVEVRYPWESGGDGEQMDRSTPLNEAVAR